MSITVNDKNLGHATAYGYAVSKGFSGTEEEFAELMAGYADVGQRAEMSAQIATSKASEASESASASEQSANSASASATTAQTKASEASALAQTATENANQASAYATTAIAKASEASASASESAQSASEASASASTASTKASEASASATSASKSAQTATTKASEASASASTAGTKASEASTSATTASTKASEASASATSAQTAQGLAESARDDAIDAKTDAESARDLAQQYAESIDPEKIYSAYPADTASGSVVTFADGADDIPMKSVVVNIEPVQSGSGDPSPDNVRPISGWTGAQVSHSGADRTNPTTYSITFPTEAGTVYGGTLDVTNGTLTVDRAMVDLGTLNWAYYQDGLFYSSSLWNLAKKNSGIISSIYISKPVPISGGQDMTAFNMANGETSTLRIINRVYTDATTFKSAMDGVQLVYQLVTPITYTLTPTEIKSLLGDNNVWADAGDTEVTYRADTAKYIDKKIAEVINALS